jgi:hypothetical protein
LVFSGDDDLDGIPNYRDELDGTNDNVDKVYMPDGRILAEVGDNV